jgi:hypothetical protein
MKCRRNAAGGGRRGCIVSRLSVLASSGPVIEIVVVVVALIFVAILLRNP